MKITARTEELIVQELGGETLVYDLKSNHAHCLNPTAAFVWRHCDGRNSMDDIVRLLQQEMNAPASTDLVSLALKHLDKAQLLSESLPANFPTAISRRDLARKLGQAGAIAALIPAVMSITANPAGAFVPPGTGSCRSLGNGCVLDTQCCSGCCSSGACQPPAICGG